MGSVIKKFIPETIKEEYPKPIPVVTEKPTTAKPPTIKPMEQVTATEGPSATEVDMASGMDGIADSLERKKKGRSKTILTGSQGLGDNANTVAPTLLG